MSEDKDQVTLKRLRELRSRAKILNENLFGDLKAFLHQVDGITFRRKPDSRSTKGDVNVTTTCSCIMALLLSRHFSKFYQERGSAEEVSIKIFKELMSAPWISSGLPNNNAFTTTLITRVFGFFVKERLLKNEDVLEIKKMWETEFFVKEPKNLIEKIKGKQTAFLTFVWNSLAENTKKLLDANDLLKRDELQNAICYDLRKIIHSGWIYEKSRFEGVQLSPDIEGQIGKELLEYEIVELNHKLISKAFFEEIGEPSEKTIVDIAKEISKNPSNFSINKYSATPAVIYWFVDGVDKAEIPLEADHWKEICKRATEEFNSQRSLFLASYDAKMDPVAMAMAACLCSRLRKICSHSGNRKEKELLEILPSHFELEHSIKKLMQVQSPSGIWPKYFPLFHYQEAGSNFCFTFELLEAILAEFSSSETDGGLLESVDLIEGLERAVTWCEKNRLSYPEEAEVYHGWNSGGDLKTLQKGQPESWATAVVHMFLWEVDHSISQKIQSKILKKYDSRSERGPTLGKMLDIKVVLKKETKDLSEILKINLIDPNRSKNENLLRFVPSRSARSALLFGPPGTSKTQIAKAIATELAWPFIEINPSHFVKSGLEGVYIQADEIFEDLMDLAGVVVLFDEMDALVQTRDGSDRLDITSQFLTTAMLPKLAKLHEKAGIIFLMATNFQERFDAAIKRAGRFDLLLCMGPPSLEQKLDKFSIFLKSVGKTDTKQAEIKIKSLIQKSKPPTKELLNLYTFGEFKALITGLCHSYSELEKMNGAAFEIKVKDDSQFILLRTNEIRDFAQSCKSEVYKEKLEKQNIEELYKIDSNEWKKILSKSEKEVPHIIRYLSDRCESKIQF